MNEIPKELIELHGKAKGAKGFLEFLAENRQKLELCGDVTVGELVKADIDLEIALNASYQAEQAYKKAIEAYAKGEL